MNTVDTDFLTWTVLISSYFAIIFEERSEAPLGVAETFPVEKLSPVENCRVDGMKSKSSLFIN